MSECYPSSTATTINYTVSGTLRDDRGNPVSGRRVELARASYGDGTSAMEPNSGSTFTGPDGGFAFERREAPTLHYDAGSYVQYRASFAGDGLYAASSSSVVKKPC